MVSLILRIEDTDSQRFVPGQKPIYCRSAYWIWGSSLAKVCRLPGRIRALPSERTQGYLQKLDQLLDAGCACYRIRYPEGWMPNGISLFIASTSTRMQMRNSLTLSEEEVKSLIDAGNQYHGPRQDRTG